MSDGVRLYSKSLDVAGVTSASASLSMVCITAVVHAAVQLDEAVLDEAVQLWDSVNYISSCEKWATVALLPSHRPA